MKKIFYLSSLLLLFLGIGVYAQEKPTSIRILITDENGKLIKKEYKSKEAMENDPELKELGVEVEVKGSGIVVRNKEGIQRISVVQEEGSNRMHIEQSGSAGALDSMGVPVPPTPPSPPLGMQELEEERQRRMELRDSILTFHQQEMEARMEKARMRREELRLEMENRREEMRRLREERGERPQNPGRNKTIIIEDLTEKDAARLGIKKSELKLEDLQINPRAEERVLDLKFRANSKAPVRILLSNQENSLFINETLELSSKSFEKAFQLPEFERGTYFLQIIQDNKVLARKIRVE